MTSYMDCVPIHRLLAPNLHATPNMRGDSYLRTNVNSLAIALDPSTTIVNNSIAVARFHSYSMQEKPESPDSKTKYFTFTPVKVPFTHDLITLIHQNADVFLLTR